MPTSPDFTKTVAIDVFAEIPGISTEKLMTTCLYTIDDPAEIAGIVSHLALHKLARATQRKAFNWLIFRLPDRTSLKTDLDEEADELRVTTQEWIHEYRIDPETSRRLSHHIRQARSRYASAYRPEGEF